MNPFAAKQGPQLPPCFDSIASQLPAVIRAKLKTVDVSTAHVVIMTAKGRKSDATPLLWFIEDFAEEAAQLVGQYGLLRVTVLEPGKQPWFFGVKVDPPEGQGAELGGGPDGGLRDFMRQMLDQQQRFMENVKMELLLTTGRAPAQASSEADFDRELSRFTKMADALRAVNGPANDPGAMIEKSFGMMDKALDGVTRLREKAETVSAGREPDAVDQFNKLTENPVVEKGLNMLMARAVNGRSAETKAGAAAPPKVNPFKKASA